MFSRILSTTAVVLAASQLAMAQTHTDCNPMEKTCPDDAALGKTLDIDFTKGPSDFFKEADGTKIEYSSEGAKFIINKETEAPTVTGQKYIFFGRVEADIKCAPGAGIITSLVLQSDNLDEVDIEWVGSDDLQVQSNYFGKGDTTTYDRGKYHQVAAPAVQWHNYALDWTPERINWEIDGKVVRTLNYKDAQGGSRFPQTPMQVKLGSWVAGGKNSPEGTREWAGGFTDFKQAPFVAIYKNIKIRDDSNGVKGATAYQWAKGSDGSYQSIKVLTTPDDNVGATTSAKPSTTKAADASTKSGEASKTTMATVTSTSNSITQATNGSDVEGSPNSSAAATGTSGSAPSGTGASAPQQSAPEQAGAVRVAAGSLAGVIGAAMLLIL